ncbi:MAG TPA: hypothetical protein VFU63_05090, partial [Ktedonobacterales bacterium]|nr:hypothetical protein [Ktedonobacterales bacterium]
VLPGCATMVRREPPPPVPCPVGPPNGCRVVIPPCQPPAYLGMGMPHDAAEQVGFLPRVATWLPDDMTWYSAGPYLPGPSAVQSPPSQPRPLMRVGYGYWFPRPYNGYALHGVIAFDETKQELGFTTNIFVPGQTLAVTATAPIDINGQAAMLFELRSSGASGAKDNETHVIGVEWQDGTIWVRVTAVTSGRYALLPNGEGDDVVAWDGMSTDVLLRVARSARLYTGCGRNVSGVS